MISQKLADIDIIYFLEFEGSCYCIQNTTHLWSLSPFGTMIYSL